MTFFVLPVAFLIACGGEKEQEYQPAVLETEKQKLSYALGSDFASPIINAGQEAEIIDFEALADGFEKSLNDEDYSSCQQVVLDAFGMNFTNPDSTKRVEGSECFGKLNGSRLYQMMKEVDQLQNIDLKYLSIGYRDGLNKRDTILDVGERASLLTKFQTEIQTAQMKKMQEKDKPFLDNAKSLKNTRVIDGGIVIETIQEGKGSSPSVSDEVVAHYILTNSVGDTIESSFDRNQPLTIGLQSVISGWTMSFPQLKKGGKYRLYIPSELAYGKGALCFYVELINFGEPGTMSAE